jgi:hypothetical protein
MIYILDINMPGISGMELALALRRDAENANPQDGLPLSHKPGEGHGLVLRSIRCAARRYMGEADFMVKDGVFYLRSYCRVYRICEPLRLFERKPLAVHRD